MRIAKPNCFNLGRGDKTEMGDAKQTHTKKAHLKSELTGRVERELV